MRTLSTSRGTRAPSTGRAAPTREPRTSPSPGAEAAGPAEKAPPAGPAAGVDRAGLPLYRPAAAAGDITALFGRIEASGLRAKVSRATGVDVRGVPVCAGDPGRGGRGSAHAGAVTLGPGATEHVAAHELAHAAQQRASSGAWLGGGEAERRADAAADAALGGGSAVAVGRMPAAAVQGDNDPYDRTGIAIPAPPPGMSAKDLKDQCDLKVKSGDISAWSTTGIKAGDAEELYLLNAIVRLADKRRWGSELDLVTDVGSGTGMVTVRFDTAGAAVARLVGKGAPVVAATYKSVADAEAGLIKTYKLAAVKGEKGKSWTLDELNKVAGAWSRLSPAEAAALEGYTLIRTDALTSATGEKLEGLTTHEDKVATGATTASHVREMRFADKTFANDSTAFIGDAKDAAPASYENLIHEVGHAVEAKPFDDLNAPAVDDTASANAAGISAHNAQLDAKNELNAARKTRIKPAEATAAKGYVDALFAAHKALGAFEGSPDAKHETAATAAITRRDAAKKKVPSGNAAVAAFATAESKQDAYLAEGVKLRAARDKAAASTAAANALKSGANTKRLQHFVDYVNANNIGAITEYSKKHWPKEPAEFYDEAFSLWKNDPAWLGKHSQKLKDFFDQGEHLKP